MRIHLVRAVVAGILGTVVMTAIGVYVAPLMGIPRMNPADMLAGAMGGNAVLGWLGHFMIGIVLAIGYAFVAPVLPGASIARGALYGLAPYLLAQIAVMPMMGMPLFSGSVSMAAGSLIGHLAYGGVVGAVHGLPAPRQAASAAA